MLGGNQKIFIFKWGCPVGGGFNFLGGGWYPYACYGTGRSKVVMGWGSLRWNGKHTIIFRGAPHYMGRINKIALHKEGRCSPHALLTIANPGSQLETKYLKPKTQADLRLFKRHKSFYSKPYKKGNKKIL